MPVSHGIKTTEITTGIRPLVTAATAVIGLICVTADEAADAAFPANTAVLVTDVRAKLAVAGTTGTLLKALTAIADHCSPQIVVVRVEPGVNADATEAAIIAAIPQLVTAESTLGVKPRILGVPGYDTQDVTTALLVVAKQLRAMVYASCDAADTIAEAVTYRGEFGDRELELIYPDFSAWDGQAIACALGLRALIDHTEGWHVSLSNHTVKGVTGISAGVSWNMQGVGTDAATLNDAPVSTIIRHNGYRFWGNRTCSDEPKFAFEPVVRTAFVIQDTIDQGLLWALDKPLTPVLVNDIVDTINAKFREMTSQGYIMGARAWYDPDVNNQVELAAGKVHIDYEFTPCAPLESLGLNSRITDRYYANFAEQLAALG